MYYPKSSHSCRFYLPFCRKYIKCVSKIKIISIRVSYRLLENSVSQMTRSTCINFITGELHKNLSDELYFKITVFWNAELYNLVDAFQNFGWTCFEQI